MVVVVAPALAWLWSLVVRANVHSHAFWRLLHSSDTMANVRQLLLLGLTKREDGVHECKECGMDFARGSDSTAWKAHLAARHPLEFHEHEAAVARLPPPAAAATAASSSPSSVVSRSSSVVSASKKRKLPDSAQPSVTAAFGAARAKPALASLALCFTMSSIAHNVVETPECQQFLRDVGWGGALPTARGLRDSVLSQAAELRSRVATELQRSPVTLATDGWTNVLKEKITNVVGIVGGRAFYWTSLVNATQRNTAVWLYEQLLPVFNTLIHEHDVRIIAFVVDNEAVNRRLHELLVGDYPFLVHVPCAAHTIQLIVRSCLASPALSAIAEQLTDLISLFDTKEKRQELRRMQDFRGGAPLALLRPNDTRWSSTFLAAERVLRIRKDLEICFEDEVASITSKEAFFTALADLVAFLQPFRSATDVLQSDSATLFSVYQQFTLLLEHVQARDEGWAATVILQRWRDNTNTPPTVASAILSFVHPPENMDVMAAQDFIVSFGCAYLSFYALSTLGEQELTDKLTLQLLQFIGREERFSTIEDKRASVLRAGGTARMVWLLYNSCELGKVALALLSVTASEAAVERTFSAQAAVHTKKRNRLHSDTVEAEMLLKFNQRQLRPGPKPDSFGSCTVMAEDFDAEEHAAAWADLLLPEPPADEPAPRRAAAVAADDDYEPPVNREAAAAAAASASSRRARGRTVAQKTVEEFIAWIVEERSIGAGFAWNNDTRNYLQSAASLHVPSRGCPSSVELERLIKEHVQQL
jgi:hypothetical protein